MNKEIRMKRFFYAVLTMVMVAFFYGCIQDTTVIHIQPDGTGTIEETTLFSNSILELMESLSGSMAGSEQQKSDQDHKEATKGDTKKEKEKTRDDLLAKMVKDAEIRAATFGTAVKFISAKPVKTDTGSGYTAVYAFQDISMVKVNQNPSDKVDAQKAEKSDSPPKEEFLRFKFMKGSPSKLDVSFPPQKEITGDKSSVPESPKAGEEKSNKESDDQSLEMMKNLFQDMKLNISLRLEGTIVNTNATYRDGSTVTLIEMDFGKIMSNPALLKQMSAAKPQTIEETKALFKRVEGLKFETNNPVTIEFK
jgi:hypothetical protein